MTSCKQWRVVRANRTLCSFLLPQRGKRDGSENDTSPWLWMLSSSNKYCKPKKLSFVLPSLPLSIFKGCNRRPFFFPHHRNLHPFGSFPITLLFALSISTSPPTTTSFLFSSLSLFSIDKRTMSAFTFETVLDTKNPFSLELLGAPSATVRHQLTGTLHLHVQKPIQFKQISVAFVGEGILEVQNACFHLHTFDILFSRQGGEYAERTNVKHLVCEHSRQSL